MQPACLPVLILNYNITKPSITEPARNNKTRLIQPVVIVVIITIHHPVSLTVSVPFSLIDNPIMLAFH